MWNRCLWLIWRSHAPSPAWDGSLLGNIRAGLRIVHGQAGAPLQVTDERRAELGVARQFGVVGCQAHQRRESETLLGSDLEVAVMREHRGIAAEPAGVVGGAAEHLAPPGRDVLAVLLADAAGKERAEQLIALDAVVEAIDQAGYGWTTFGPLVQRRRLAHPVTVTL
jgi:hypothetical protein